MASIEKYQEFLEDIASLSESEFSLENKSILLNVLDTPQMQANIPNEALGDLARVLKTAATASKLTPSAILTEVNNIKEKNLEEDQYRQENRGETTIETETTNQFAEAALSAALVTTLINEYNVSEETAQRMAETSEALDYISTHASEETQLRVIAGKLTFLYGDNAEKTNAKWESDLGGESLKKDDLLKYFLGHISREVDPNGELGLEKMSTEELKDFLEKRCDGLSQETKDQIAQFFGGYIVASEIANEKISYDDFKLTYYSAIDTLYKDIYFAGEQAFEQACEQGVDDPNSIKIKSNNMAALFSVSGISFDNSSKKAKRTFEQIAQDETDPGVRSRLETAAKNIGAGARIYFNLNKSEYSQEQMAPNEAQVVSNNEEVVLDSDMFEFALENSEDIPAGKDSSLSPSTKESKPATTHVPQETEETTYDIKDYDFSDVGFEGESPSEEITESVTEADDIEHDPNKEEPKPGVEHYPDAGLDALARGEKEVEREPEEVVIDDKQNQPVTYNWRDVLIRFIKRITGRTKAIEAPQKEISQDDQPQEPPKGEEVKKNDDNFLTRIAKALGMKKEEPVPEVEKAKADAKIKTSASFQHVAVDVKKAVEETEQANKKQNNGKETPKKDEETHEQ